MLHAQHQLRGTVLDSSRTYPLEAVSVMSTSGKGTTTDVAGNYQLQVNSNDSVWFSYLGKPTIKFPVRSIPDLTRFDIALRVPVTTLKEIRIRPRYYRQDSAQNRADYAKVFNFRKPGLETMTSMGPMGAGIDLDEVIRLFQFRKNKSMLRFQQRLLLQEQEKFIDYRFSKQLVHRLTGLEGAELDAFMKAYRPPYEAAVYASDYEFQELIRISFDMYLKDKKARKGF